MSKSATEPGNVHSTGPALPGRTTARPGPSVPAPTGTTGWRHVAKCAEAYMRYLIERGAMRSTNVDKSFAHACLAAMPDPNPA